MKRIISLILCVLIAFVSMLTVVSAESVEIGFDDFTSQFRQMAYYYDSGALNSEVEYFQTDRLIVKTETNAPLLNYYGAVDIVEGYDGLHLLQFNNEYAADYAYNCLLKDNIEYVEYDFYFSLDSNTQSDGLDSINNINSWNSEATDVEEAFEFIKKSNITTSDVHVAVIDSGIYAGHNHFSDGETVSKRIENSGYVYKITYGEGENQNTLCFSSREDDLYHGTHVSSIIFDNTLDNVYIWSYRMTNRIVVNYLDACFALEAAVNNTKIDIINMSFSVPNSNCYRMQSSINNALEKGIVIVACAGNVFLTDLASEVYPAANPNIITVAASNESSSHCSFSNHGEVVDIAAPGENIYGPVPRIITNSTTSIEPANKELYNYLSGTSQAAPLVSAAAALLKSINPDITPAEVERIIKETAYIPKGWDTDYGSGILNFYNMVKNYLEPEKSAKPIVKLNSDFEVEATLPEGVEGNIYCLPGQNLTIDNYQHYTGPIPTTNPGSCISFVCHEKGKLISDPVVFWIKQYINLTVERFRTEHPLSGSENLNITWRSFDPDIAKVDQNGNITGVSVGETQVYATFDSGLRITYVVTVEPPWWHQLLRLLFFGFIWYRI